MTVINLNGQEPHVANGINSMRNSPHKGAQDSNNRPAQDPIAVIGFACRLPDDCNNPVSLWKFLERGSVAKNEPPLTRYDIKTHYDGTRKEKTMASPGGMYLQSVDPRDLDAQFFKLSRLEALSMDPQQRQLLEVVYEGLENCGITLEQLNGRPIGCFVGSFACDYGDIQARDPEDRAPATVIGTGRAMLSNRISHFLNIKGPSMTIDTACSGSLTGLDVACRYLQAREIEGAIIGGANIYMSPEHVMDWHMGSGGTASHSGKCHTFDAKADGYIKAEAINMVYVKRLADAIRDGDPIRAVIRGTAVNSDGWTAGIASPNADAQAVAIRQAYANAGITDLSLTGYVEFHGTGTRAGDVIEVNGVASVFREFRTPDKPLHIGSVKSNIGHSEPAAGISGLLKAILALEHEIIPGNPTFEMPNPKLDFADLRLLPSRTAVPWPANEVKRASVNSFGYGGSNAHVIVDSAKGLSKHVSSYDADVDSLFEDDEVLKRPYLMVLSANDSASLEAQLAGLDRHLSDPSVRVKIRDLIYTLSEKRSRHFHRGYTVVSNHNLSSLSLNAGVNHESPPTIGFIFTGQGAQWPQMGKDLVNTFPVAAKTILLLDEALQELSNPPSWKLWDALTQPLTGEELRSPELSQPIVTALQLAILSVFTAAGVSTSAVVGHSSGEIAAATAAGYLTPEQAIKIAYLRGQATISVKSDAPLGMLAAGLGPEGVQRYIVDKGSQIACINGPESVTISGYRSELEVIETAIKTDGKFARLLQVNAAYHSRHMLAAGDVYLELLRDQVEWPQTLQPKVAMFSSTTGKILHSAPGPEYWVQNMVSPVLFSQATGQMIKSQEELVDIVIEIGPSSALAGPVHQIKKSIKSSVEYHAAWKRGPEALGALLDLSGNLFVAGYPINISQINADSDPNSPAFVVDLPNYVWNHSVKYWYESESSADWRFRKFVHHDILGSKILGTSWQEPTWKKTVKLQEAPWLKDHKLSESVIFPASGYLAMAIEALFQKSRALGRVPAEKGINQLTYQLRDVRFDRALPLDDQERDVKILLALVEQKSDKASWHEFRISSVGNGTNQEHCRGLVGIIDVDAHTADENLLRPLEHSTPADSWYKAMAEVGYSFGPSFQRLVEVEAVAGQRTNRALVSFDYPQSSHRQSRYPLHPASIDSCFQAGSASLYRGHRSEVSQLLLPAIVDELTIYSQVMEPARGLAVAAAEFAGKGRKNDAKRYKSNVDVYDVNNGRLVFRLKGLHYHGLDAAIESHLKHTYTRLGWAPDVTFLSAAQLRECLGATATSEIGHSVDAVRAIGQLTDLVAHKKGYVRLLEKTLLHDGSSLWLDRIRPLVSETASIGCDYTFSLPTQDVNLEARSRYGIAGGIEFVVDGDESATSRAARENGEPLDIVLVQASTPHISEHLWAKLQTETAKLSRNGFVVVVYRRDVSHLVNGYTHPHVDGESNGKKSDASFDASEFEPVISCQASDLVAADGPQLLFVGKMPGTGTSLENREARVIHFGAPNSAKATVVSRLIRRGLSVIEHQTLPAEDEIPDGCTIVVLDEISVPVMSCLQEGQLAVLQYLMRKKCRLLWVTSGAHMAVTNPECSLFVGFLRSILAEDPTNILMTVDIESGLSQKSIAIIMQTLCHLESVDSVEFAEREWVERGGIPYVSRVVPDSALNKAERNNTFGAEPVMKALFQNEPTTRLINTRVGTLDGLVFAEVSESFGPRHVEVEIYAAALNFKDLAHIMGFIPSNEERLGLECAGIVTRVGPDARWKVKEGDRVVLIRRDGGCFANRVRSRVDDCCVIPDDWKFEDAAAVGVCFMTAIYGLIDLAHIKKGDTVLIHSAAGGVGLACLQLCEHFGAEVYVTVGTDEKRKFIREVCNIPEDRIFSSRSTAFARQIVEATGGRGVDIVMNSLSGDMLHESWRCVATNGTFVEIGKKDILERNSLCMEPFNRSASFRAFDLSYICKDRVLANRLTDYIFEKAREGIIKPIHICKTFDWNQIVDAVRYMRDGKHIGKIVITTPDRSSVKVPTRPLPTKLLFRPDVAYIVVGGFKGLCASLAIYLAREGVKHLVVMGRSGYDDTASQATLMHLSSLGCQVDLVRGDVTKIDDVRGAFKVANKPVSGIIMGAMILRDHMFDTMTIDQFRGPIEPKIIGTWNLHHVSLEQTTSLDFFLLLSSISGVGGQRAQTNYSGANAFQDSFAQYRRSLGLPACAVDLGVVEDVGYFTGRDKMAERLRLQGWTPINEALLHKILRFGLLRQQEQQQADSTPTPLGHDVSAQVITGISNPLGPNSPQRPVHRFSALRPRAVDGHGAGADGAGSQVALLRAATRNPGEIDAATLLATAVAVVNGVLMVSLGLREPLEPSRPLGAYGIDSLVAVELRNWVRTELAVELSALEIVGAKTLVSLCEVILKKLVR